MRVNSPACLGIFAATIIFLDSPGGIVTGKLPVTLHVQSVVPPINRIGWSVRLTTSTDVSRASPGAPGTNIGQTRIQRNPFAAKLSQGGIGRIVEQCRKTGKQRQ